MNTIEATVSQTRPGIYWCRWE